MSVASSVEKLWRKKLNYDMFVRFMDNATAFKIKHIMFNRGLAGIMDKTMDWVLNTFKLTPESPHQRKKAKVNSMFAYISCFLRLKAA